MRLPTLTFLGLAATLPSVSAAPNAQQTTCTVNGNKHKVDEVITRDVAVIGGGSAGTYSAIRLRDMGKSVVVIEGKDRLGGHTETYTDPLTNATLDFGVQVFHPIDIVKNYFARLGVAGQISPDTGGPPGVTAFPMNLLTGELFLTPPPDFSAALGQYTGLLLQYPYIDYGFDLPDPVPADLLMPFGDFISKYNLQALAAFAYFFTQGVGDIINMPTIYVVKSFSINSILDIQTGFWRTTANDNSLLYVAAQGILGSDVQYNSKILDVQRSDNGSQVVIKSAGKRILIKSKKLIIAIQPTLDNLKNFDLTHQEGHLFSQWKSSQYITGLIRHSGIPGNTTLNNVAPLAPLGMPPPPSLYLISQTGVPDLMNVYYVDTGLTSDTSIQKIILEDVKRVNVPGKTVTEPEFAVYSNHKPFTLWVDAPAIQHGFYKSLLSLQGKQNCWYISATMHTHDSSLIWRYAEGLLAAIAA